jgi:hypothetical protein
MVIINMNITKRNRGLILFLITAVIASAFSVMLSGCGKNVKKNILPPDVYYQKAVHDSQNKNYRGAAKNFKAPNNLRYINISPRYFLSRFIDLSPPRFASEKTALFPASDIFA